MVYFCLVLVHRSQDLAQGRVHIHRPIQNRRTVDHLFHQGKKTINAFILSLLYRFFGGYLCSVMQRGACIWLLIFLLSEVLFHFLKPE